MLKHYEGEHCMNWRRTEGHDKTVSACFPCLWPEIKEGGVYYKLQLMGAAFIRGWRLSEGGVY